MQYILPHGKKGRASRFLNFTLFPDLDRLRAIPSRRQGWWTARNLPSPGGGERAGIAVLAPHPDTAQLGPRTVRPVGRPSATVHCAQNAYRPSARIRTVLLHRIWATRANCDWLLRSKLHLSASSCDDDASSIKPQEETKNQNGPGLEWTRACARTA